MVELIEGTALPVHTGPGGFQPEGRGATIENPERAKHSLLEKIANRDDILPHEAAIVGAALRAYDRAPKHTKTVFDQLGDQTDATTGNMILQLYEVPQGSEGRVNNVTVDSPAFTPAAPFANASSFAFLASLPPGTNPDDAAVVTARNGLIAFAPSAAAGPIIPGQWTFGSHDAPIVWGGKALYFVLVGGSIAAVKNIPIQVSFRINIYSSN